MMLVLCFVATGILNAQYCFVPNVINEDRTDPVFLEYKTSDFSTNVNFELDGVLYEMYDNGQNGDRVAGDRVFTFGFDPQLIVSTMQEDDAFRPSVGFVHPCIGDDTYKCVEVFLPVRTNDMPDIPVATYGNDMQVSPYVINIRSAQPLTYVQVFQRLQVYNISRDVDFLVMMELPSRNAIHRYTRVRNDVSGIGLPLFNDVTSPSVPARFKGVLTLPVVDKFDGVSRQVVRSLALQWAPNLGPPFSVCEHWAVSDLARSIVGYDANGVSLCYSENFQYRIVEGSGTNDYRLLPAPRDVKYFNNLDLYLMGLKRANEVEPFRIFREQAAVLNALRMQPLAYHGPVDNYTIDDVIRSEGPRVPGFDDAPKEFRVYTVIISPELLTRDEMAYFDHMARRGESEEVLYTRNGSLKELGVSFKTATHGTGTMSWNINNMIFPQRNIAQYVCYGEVFEFNGSEYTEPGSYSGIIENQNGKDTLFELELTWLPKSEDAFNAEFCMGETYDFNGKTLESPGVYFDTMTNAVGCDSFITLDLAVLPSDIVEFYEVICSDQQYIFAGDTLTEAGVYFDMYTNSYGCDSAIMLSLEVEPAVEAGVISASGNQHQYTFCIGDGLQDLLWFTSTSDSGGHAYVHTDVLNRVIDIVFEPVYDFETTGTDPARVWSVSFSGNLILNPGDDLFASPISDQCYDISSNRIEVYKQTDGAVCAFIHEDARESDDDFTVAPNPAVDVVTIALNLRSEIPRGRNATLEIIGVDGVVQESIRIQLQEGIQTWQVNVGQLAPGVYLVRVTGSDHQLRFVKI